MKLKDETQGWDIDTSHNCYCSPEALTIWMLGLFLCLALAVLLTRFFYRNFTIYL